MFEITTILFDIGWPIIDETRIHTAWNIRLKELVIQKAGKDLTDGFIKEAESEAVRCYAPSLFSYVIWQAVSPREDLFREIRREFDSFYSSREYLTQEGVDEVLSTLTTRFKLGLAANQPVEVYDYLKNEGILKYFDSTQVSGEIGYSKPDIRMFTTVLENLKSRPDESLMVGDRQDNDIVPARLLGMKTVRLLVGPHKDQIIRYPAEKPDYEITHIKELLELPVIKRRL